MPDTEVATQLENSTIPVPVTVVDSGKPEKVSIRDSINRAFDEVEKTEAAPADKPAKAAPAKPAEKPLAAKPAETAKTEAPADGRERNPDGTFKPKSGEAPEVAAAPEPVLTAKDAQPDIAALTPQVGPPPAWPKEKHALWANVPAEVKDFLIKREDDISKGFAKYGEESRRLKEYDAVMAPRRALLQQAGRTDAQAIHQLWTWHDALANPATAPQTIRDLARNYNVNLETPAPNGSEQTQVDPQQQLLSQISKLVQEQVAPIQQGYQTVQQRLETEQAARTAREIEAWSNGKPHFEKVRVTMGQLMQAGVATTLDEAYQKATQLDPDITADIAREAEAKRAQEAATKESERKAAEAKQIEQARKAGSSVGTEAPSGKPAVKPKAKSIRENLEEAWGQAGA